ncbi:prepilin-type N-terminal cleavage/methylation domain-containing protein [Catenovulum sp. SM1970]|uniref:prepilin-type N-terminal cleavage/methylation domain-containing protein n=1 Tax=Marinifaba aquimaris TaxID=2741323 RepID=UPI001572EAC6|nr:prepilin-type N-terminal cleavage/methylation domain-containing protein [Marinifaba aquimaris]NTS75869.1 prepilin-type N-terminal cleavage/methylation domain-containing protein [Marinifaba aquimaris]
MYKKSRAFTLVELVLVILLLGISLVGVTTTIGWGTQVYVDGIDRQRMLEQSRFVIERITRELRSAVPYSVRISTSCIEFVPMIAGSTYTDLAVTPASSNTISALHDNNYSFSSGDQILLGLTSTIDVYNPIDNTRIDMNNYTVNESGVIDTATITLSGTTSFAERFEALSNKPNRYYIANQSVSYCLNFTTNQIRRFTSTISASQPNLGSASSTALMAEGIVNTSGATPAVFSFADIEQSTVQIYWQFASEINEEPMIYYHQVKVSNAN